MRNFTHTWPQSRHFFPKSGFFFKFSKKSTGDLLPPFPFSGYQQCVTVHHVPKCIVFMITYILRPSCFCEIWALYVSWITYDHLYDHINILHILYYIILHVICMHIYYILWYLLLLYCYYKYITYYIYYIFNGIHTWRLS